MEVLGLLPDGVGPFIALALVCVSLIASSITASLGLGGGMLMLSVMALVFPPAILIPVHGAIQLGSNAGRATVQRAHIQWHVVLWISLGALLGSSIGVRFAAQLPEKYFMLAIAIFILAMTWLPRPKVRTRGPVMSFAGGALISFTGMIVGVTGPLVLSFIRAIGDRKDLVATHAALMTFQNAAKITAFVFYGFAFYEFVPLLLAMIAAGFVGTLIGTKILKNLPEHVFQIAFKVIVTAIAIDLLRRSLFNT